MATTIFPSTNDVAPATGGGRIATEANLAALLSLFRDSGDWVLTGLTPSAGAGLTLNVAAGEAFIEGYRVVEDAALSIALPDAVTRGVYLQLSRDVDANVTGAALLASTSTTPGAVTDAVLLAKVVTAGGAISQVHDERRAAQGLLTGVYTGDDVASRTIALSRTPQYVVVSGNDTGAPIVAHSGIQPTGYHAFGVAALALPGFRVSKTASSVNVLGHYLASATWDITALPQGNSVSTTITVVGAAIGDPAIADHDDLDTAQPGWLFRAKVTASDTVTVTATNLSGGTDTLSGTIRVTVFRATSVVNNWDARYNAGADGTKVPYIVAGGFKVGHNAGDLPSLNETGEVYRYAAWM